MILPPKKRDWIPGTVQTGLFLRSDRGTIIESVVDHADRDVAAAAWWLLHVSACRGCNHCGPARGKALRAYEMLSDSIARSKIARAKKTKKAPHGAKKKGSR